MNPRTVIVRSGPTGIVIAEPDAPDGVGINIVRLGLSGAVLSFDVSLRTPALRLEISDLLAASWWLGSIIGEEIADELLGDGVIGDSSAPTSASIVEHTIEASAPVTAPLRAMALRLGLALWLRRWAPSIFDHENGMTSEWLLEAEGGDLAYGLDTALSPDQPLAQQLLTQQLSRLAAASRAHHSLVDSAAGRDVDNILMRAMRAAREACDPESTGYDEVVQSIQRITADEKYIAETMNTFESSVSALAEATRQSTFAGPASGALASSATAPTSTMPWGSAPADPQTVPARVIAASDDAIHWTTAREDDGLKATVHVDAVPGSNPMPFGTLFVRIDCDGRTAVASLALDKSMATYTGEVWLDSTLQNSALYGLLITVFGGVRGSDTMEPRTTGERRADHDAIAKILSARGFIAQSSLGGAADTSWDRAFAAEIVDHTPGITLG